MMKVLYLLLLVFMTSTVTVSRADNTLACDFEETHICSYAQDNTDEFDWTRKSNKSSFGTTGPSNDHTFSSSVAGHYMYTEATPMRLGDKARLISKMYNPPATAQCLEFWYHMYGADMGTLSVYFKRGGNLGNPQFTEQGDKGDSWLLASVGVPANSQPFQLVFEGVRGSSWSGDIAIDDVDVKPWDCGISPDAGPDSATLEPNTTSLSILEGSDMQAVTCDCGHCIPNCTIQWSFHGKTVGNSSSLQLEKMVRNAAGTYNCTCMNPATLKSERTHFVLYVIYGPDDVVLTPDNTTYTLQDGSSLAHVTCNCGNCEPNCRAQWTFNGIIVSDNDTLELNDVTTNTTGQFTCICTNPTSLKQETQHLSLTVQFGPNHAFLTPNNNTYTIEEGSTMPKVMCTCGDCEPGCVAQWSFKGVTIGDYTSLALGNVSRTDTGNYTCTCINPSTLKQEKNEYEIMVEYGPDGAILTPDNTSYILEEGYSELDVLCYCAECTPSCSLEWTVDGVTIGNNHSVKINKTLRDHTGQYTCICSNPSTLKQEASHFNVNVRYGPDNAIITPNLTSYNKTVGSHLGNITCSCGKCEPNCIVEWTLNDVPVSKNNFIFSDRLSIGDNGHYLCTCLNPASLKTQTRQFNLIVNALPNVKPCPQNTDDRRTSWIETLAGEVVSKECQGKDTTGSISRVCSKTGEWLIPRYNCIRSSFNDVEDKLEEITRNSSNSDVSDVLSELVNLTDTNEGDVEMYSRELEIVTRALDIVANSDHPPTEEQSRSFINVVSNILSEEKKRSWKSLSHTKAEDGVSKLLQAVDSLSEAMTKGLEDTNTSVITIIQPNIVLEARKVDASQQEIQFPMPSTTPNMETFAGAQLSLSLQHGSASDVRRYTVALYKSLAGVLPNTVATRNDSENDRNQMLNTPVVSLQMFPYRAKLYKPLNLVFEHQQVNVRHPKCSYWSFHGHRWETDGCHVKSSTGSQTTCECDRLTNFAVLMSPLTEPAADSTAIEIISIVGCSISIVCLIATAAVHILLWRNLKNDRAIILINICVALSETYIIFLSGINQTSDTGACAAVAALLHYILLVVFCLMLAEGIEIAITVKYVFLTKSRIKWMILLAWGIPAAIVGLSMGITRLKGYGTENFCWLSVENGVIWAFVGPAMLIIVMNVVFLAILLRTMLKTKAYLDMSELDRIKCSARCLCVLVPLMGCTWVLGIFYVNDRTAWIQYVFALCNSLQGFFIFLFHGLLNKHLRTAIKSRHKKYKDSHSLSKSHSTRRTEVTCALNPVYSSDVAIESKPNPVQKYGRKLSLQFKKTGSYSPMQE